MAERQTKPTSFAGRLKAARERLELSQVQAAEKCGVSRKSWNDLERGGREPTLDRVWRLATCLGVCPNALDSRLAKAKPGR